MNKILSLFFLGFGFIFINAQDLDRLNNQKESLKLNLDLVNKQIDLEKEKKENEKINQELTDLNAQSSKTENLNPSNTEIAAKEAKKTARLLKQIENKNKDLSRSNDKIIDLEADIRKINNRVEKLKLKIDYK